MRRPYLWRAVTGAMLLGALADSTAFGQARMAVIMTGLDSPRGLAIGPEGALYVVEAGRGGSGPCVVLRGAAQCFGATGALTRLWNGRVERVVTGLPSMINPAGEVTGAHDVSFAYRGGAYLTIGLSNGDGDPDVARRNFGPGGERFGTLQWVSATWDTRTIADLSAHEFRTNPAGGPTDSNPFGVLADVRGVLVADAGANALLGVENSGRVSTEAVFPSAPVRAMDAVPTAVARGPDGAYYVSELTGAPFVAGAARIYRVTPGATPQIFADGFKTLIDLAVHPDGSVYVLEHASAPTFFAGPGDVVRVAKDGTRRVVVQGLDRPTALAIDQRGTLYITNHGLSVGAGEVVRVDP